MTLSKQAPRAKSRWAALGAAVVAGSVLLVPTVFATAPSSGAGFEASDGNLAAGSNPDWNSFSPLTWTGSVPYQIADKTISTGALSGWHVQGLTDAQASTSDSGFAGGVKQDDNCATVKGGKAPNKDDLKRAYIATKTAGDGHTYLMLAWERIPQNTVNASAHVGFEFNQSDTACGGTTHDGLVQRTADDMLIVYDFEGSSSGAASLSIRRWTTTAGAACDVSSDSPPCWGVPNALNSTQAEARVNTTGFPTLDTLAGGSGSPAIASTGQNLGQSEFGEAGIDLNAAGVFSSTTCTSFGQAEVISRSSGNSSQAAMEDLVGPASFTVSNCGTLIVKKVTVPSPDTTDTAFGFTTSGGGTSNAAIWPSTTVSLKNGDTYNKDVFPATDFSAQETSAGNFSLTSASCDNSTGSLTGTTLSAIHVAANETVTCTFTNTKNKATPSVATQIHLDDKATISGGDSPTGSVTFKLYDTAACAGSVIAEFDNVALSGGTASTVGLTPDSGSTFVSTGKTYSWKVTYNGDTGNNDVTVGCTVANHEEAAISYAP